MRMLKIAQAPGPDRAVVQQAKAKHLESEKAKNRATPPPAPEGQPLVAPLTPCRPSKPS